MFHNRPCGCKGQRSCLLCEQEFGAWSACKDISDSDKANSMVYCPLCDLVWPGWALDSWSLHPNHTGSPQQFPGIKVLLNFVTEAEESQLLQHVDEVPWDTSQSGRVKQNYGPKCNFKKRKVKLDDFSGYPEFTRYIQDRFSTVALLKDFQTVEQCSLDYTPAKGASIDPHIDDCWIWGERIPTLSLHSDSVLTLTKYEGKKERYNLPDVSTYPSVVDKDGNVKTMRRLQEFYVGNESENGIAGAKTSFSIGTSVDGLDSCGAPSIRALPRLVRVPMPRRSLLILYGTSRYEYEHSILRSDVPIRRVCITYRELTPTFLKCGPQAAVGEEIIRVAKQFWDHKEVYRERAGRETNKEENGKDVCLLSI